MGHLVLTTASGTLKVMPLAKLSPVAELSPGPSEKYICATYCSGKKKRIYNTIEKKKIISRKLRAIFFLFVV